MLIADSTPDPTALGQWIQIFFYIVLAVCGVISTIAVVIKALRKKEPSPDSDYITRGEMEGKVGRIEDEADKLKDQIIKESKELKEAIQKDLKELKDTAANFVTRAELTREVDRIDKDSKEIKSYIQTRMHDQGNKLHAINLRIVWIMGVLTQLAGKTDDVKIPPEPMIATPDEA